MLDLLLENDPNLSVCLAEIILIQAGIPPYNDHGGEADDQYCIEAFEIDIHKIRIVNHGVEHLLKCVKT